MDILDDRLQQGYEAKAILDKPDCTKLEAALIGCYDLEAYREYKQALLDHVAKYTNKSTQGKTK